MANEGEKNNIKLEDMTSEIKTVIVQVGNKIDAHFSNWEKVFGRHEQIEVELLQANAEHMKKLDESMGKMQETYDKKFKNIGNTIKWLKIALAISLTMSIATSVITFLSLWI